MAKQRALFQREPADRIVIVGSGIVGSTLAFLLTRRGHPVTVLEKGPEYPYPHAQQFQRQHVVLHPDAAYELPRSLKNYTSDGIPFDLERERYMRVGGSASAWEGICLRMLPSDFRTATLYGYGHDWPITYDDLEPYYGQAEALIGVAGTDGDNPFAPPRSTPYPLPPFALAYDDLILAERLAAAGIILHTTPQARTRRAYEGRPACVNFGTCRHCPIGARYSPNHHLDLAAATGLCRIITNASVRRIGVDSTGTRATSVVYRLEGEAADRIHDCDLVIVAAGAIESARLLLLSRESGLHRDGLGNGGGQVGAGLAFHNVWTGRMRYDEALYPGRLGGWTGQSLQFADADTRGQHAAVKVEFSTRVAYEPPMNWRTVNHLREALLPQLQWRPIVLQTESPSSPEKYVTLSSQTDRHGDAFAHIFYRMSELDAATYVFARSVFDRFVSATRAAQSEFPPFDWFDSGSHHMGGCRMGTNPDDSVVNSFGQVHGLHNLFVIGGGSFVGTSGAANPTLTMVALAIRSADFILDQILV